jgi:shikimate kinase
VSGRRTVAIIGPMGAGKTSIGRKLAKRLERPFVDTDAQIVAAHGPISDLFAAQGERGFRAVERAAVERALTGGGVVSLGGGAVLDPGTRTDLERCTVVLLTVSEDAVAERLASGRRPLLVDGLESWRRIAAERRPVYEALADITIDTSRRPVAQIVDELAERIQTAPVAP